MSPAPVPPNRGLFALAVPIATGRCALDAFIQLGEVNVPARPKITFICAAIGRKPRASIGYRGERWKVIGPSARRPSPVLLRGRVERPPGRRTAPCFSLGVTVKAVLLARRKQQNGTIGTRKALPGRSLPVLGPCFGTRRMYRKAAPLFARPCAPSSAPWNPLCRALMAARRKARCRNRLPTRAVTTPHRLGQ